MVACSICTQEIPKPKRCAHGRKLANCTRMCQAAYVGEHEAECQTKKDTIEDEKAKGIEATSGDQDAAGANVDSGAGGAEADLNAAEADHNTAEADHNAVEPDHNTAEPDHNAVEPDHNAAGPDHNAAEVGGRFDFDLVRQVRNNEMFTCRNCFRMGTERLLRCGGCLLIGYCGRECQRVHWHNMHKRQCELMRDLAEAAMSNENLEAASG